MHAPSKAIFINTSERDFKRMDGILKYMLFISVLLGNNNMSTSSFFTVFLHGKCLCACTGG
jgi:hypothetical protein